MKQEFSGVVVSSECFKKVSGYADSWLHIIQAANGDILTWRTQSILSIGRPVVLKGEILKWVSLGKNKLISITRCSKI